MTRVVLVMCLIDRVHCVFIQGEPGTSLLDCGAGYRRRGGFASVIRACGTVVLFSRYAGSSRSTCRRSWPTRLPCRVFGNGFTRVHGCVLSSSTLWGLASCGAAAHRLIILFVAGRTLRNCSGVHLVVLLGYSLGLRRQSVGSGCASDAGIC